MRLVLPSLLILAVCASAQARTVVRNTRQLAFEYAWPALPAGLKQLEARLASEAAADQRNARRNAVETWKKDRAADSQGDPPRHSYEKKWAIEASTPRLLSLSAAVQVYTGGAHEGIAYDALLWDRKADRALPLASLFTRPKPALAAMARAYCAQLKADQRERRGDGYRDSDFRCPALARAPVVLTGKGRISGIEVLLEPYAAGSWAEGPYEVEVRFSPALLELVKPEYRGEFGR